MMSSGGLDESLEMKQPVTYEKTKTLDLDSIEEEAVSPSQSSGIDLTLSSKTKSFGNSKIAAKHPSWADKQEASSMNRAIRPGPNDVVFGRGQPINRHQGNILFRKMVQERKEEYLFAKSNKTKADITKDIIMQIRSLKPPGRFLIKDENSPADEGDTERMKNCWIEASPLRAFTKTRQALGERGRKIRKDAKRLQEYVHVTPEEGDICGISTKNKPSRSYEVISKLALCRLRDYKAKEETHQKGEMGLDVGKLTSEQLQNQAGKIVKEVLMLSGKDQNTRSSCVDLQKKHGPGQDSLYHDTKAAGVSHNIYTSYPLLSMEQIASKNSMITQGLPQRHHLRVQQDTKCLQISLDYLKKLPMLKNDHLLPVLEASLRAPNEIPLHERTPVSFLEEKNTSVHPYVTSSFAHSAPVKLQFEKDMIAIHRLRKSQQLLTTNHKHLAALASHEYTQNKANSPALASRMSSNIPGQSPEHQVSNMIPQNVPADPLFSSRKGVFIGNTSCFERFLPKDPSLSGVSSLNSPRLPSIRQGEPMSGMTTRVPCLDGAEALLALSRCSQNRQQIFGRHQSWH